ncbi:MAG: mannose-6-phosphate isomerase, partial [Rhodobiaceae bacterium]
MPSVNIADKLNGVTDHWAPKIIACHNDNDIMVVKVQGKFIWNSPDDTDDFFLVLSRTPVPPRSISPARGP